VVVGNFNSLVVLVMLISSGMAIDENVATVHCVMASIAGAYDLYSRHLEV